MRLTASKRLLLLCSLLLASACGVKGDPLPPRDSDEEIAATPAPAQPSPAATPAAPKKKAATKGP